MRRRHAISPVFSGHYQDLGVRSLKGHDSAYNLTAFLAWEAGFENHSLCLQGVVVMRPVICSLRERSLRVPGTHPLRGLGAAVLQGWVLHLQRCHKPKARLGAAVRVGLTAVEVTHHIHVLGLCMYILRVVCAPLQDSSQNSNQRFWIQSTTYYGTLCSKASVCHLVLCMQIQYII